MASVTMDRDTRDTLINASTPEGLRFILHLAGPYPRCLAFALDSLIQGAIIMVAAIIIQLTMQEANWLILLIFFMVQWFYGSLLEGFNKGRTIGKLAVGLQVVHTDGTIAGFGAIMLRNLIRAGDMFYFCFLIGLLIVGGSPTFQRLGDLAASTIVIHRPKGKRRSGHFTPDPDIIPQAPPQRLDASQSQAIIAFAQRCKQFSPARSRDLAGLAIQGLYGNSRHFEDPVRQLLSLAAWLAGYRQVIGAASTSPKGLPS